MIGWIATWGRWTEDSAVLALSSGRTRHWYERLTEDWKDADPDIPELIEARERLAELKTAENTSQ